MFRIYPQVRLDLRVQLVFALLFAVAVVWLVISRSCTRNARVPQAKADFLESCSSQQELEHCERLLQQNHRRCFELNYRYGSRTSVTHFRRQHYERCVLLGEDEWIRENGRRREARERERKKLGLPPGG